MNHDGDDLVFSTGKRLDANNGFVGINEKLEICEGYDAMILSNGTYGHGWLRRRLTQDELEELCGYMIDLWSERRRRKVADEK